MKRMVEWKYINEDSKKYDNGKITFNWKNNK